MSTYLSGYRSGWNLGRNWSAETFSMCFVKQGQAFEIILSNLQSPLESSVEVMALGLGTINQESQNLHNSASSQTVII